MYYAKVSLYKISKANEFWLARYLNIYKSGQSKNKKINSSWNTHSIKKRPCAFLRIMISYLCVKFQSLTSLHRRDILVTDGRTNGRTDGQTDECEFIGHRFVKPVTNKQIKNSYITQGCNKKGDFCNLIRLLQHF